jgi:thiol-disulfide isomerase/thioredoxin
MSEGPEAGSKPKGGALTWAHSWALWGAALVGVAAVVYIIAQSSTNPAPVVATVPVAETPTPFAKKVSTPKAPIPAPDYVFYDSSGKPLKIADFKGKVVVMNTWATWCAPCKAEMPTLAKMAAAYAGKPVEVVAISIDETENADKAALFIAQNDPLKFYHDRQKKIVFKINARGTPTTVIYGKDGLEQARVSGDADWTSPAARALVDKALAGGR